MKVMKKTFNAYTFEISQQLTNSRRKENLTFNPERTTMSFRTLKGKKKEHENERIEEEKRKNWRRRGAGVEREGELKEKEEA